MPEIRKTCSIVNRLSGDRSHRPRSFYGYRWTLMRCLLVSLAFLAPATMVTAVSCGINCSAQCEPSSQVVACIELSASNCHDGGADYACAVRSGCHCARVTDPTVGCNSYACSVAEDQANCAKTIGCEWGDACRDLIDCRSLRDQSACEANSRQCRWSKNCG